MNFDPNQKEMHPSDKRNLIIFVLASLVIWFGFEHFVIGPKLEESRKQQAVVASNAPQVGTENPADAIIPRATKIAETPRIQIATPEIIGSLPTLGNRIDDITLKTYFVDLKNTQQVSLLSPAGTERPHYAEIGWLAADSTIAVPDKNTQWSTSNSTPLTPSTPVTFTWSNGSGLEFQKTISIDSKFMMTITQRVTNTSGHAIDLYPYAALTRRGLPEYHGKGMGYEGPIGYIADDLHEISYKNLEKDGAQKFTALNGWIGFGEKYWLSAILPAQLRLSDFTFKATVNASDPAKNIYQVDQRGEKETIDPGKTVEITHNLFVGAKQIKVLDQYEDTLNIRHFDLAVDFGSLYFLTKPLYFMLITFYGWVGNFGLAIILLTIVVRGAVYPLASKSYRSFAGLRKVAPKMAEIKARYGDDKKRLQEEMIKLYETEKVNPMAGCLPILLQMPILFAVYRVMSIAVEMRHAPFFGWIHDLSAQDTLSIFNGFGLLPFDLPSFLMIGPWSVAMLVLMLIQKQLNPPPQDKMQRDIANYMPWIITLTLSGFPVGLVIYWAFSNLLSVIQQAVIMKSMGVPIYIFSPDQALAHAEEHKKETEKLLAEVENEKKSGKSPEKNKDKKK